LAAVKNVYFIHNLLSGAEYNALLNCADVFVSLHRAEGFGLVCAEAMLSGKPVIATNWSANTEFMTPASSCLVDYTMQPLNKEYPPFAKGTRWAEPDLTHAASHMLRLYNDRAYCSQMGQAAKEHIKNVLSIGKITKIMKNRIDTILAFQGGTP
jgi:glycosyltransferase involved in cell wall biosynthesis